MIVRNQPEAQPPIPKDVDNEDVDFEQAEEPGKCLKTFSMMLLKGDKLKNNLMK